MRSEVLVATTNPAKQERLRSLLAGQGVVFHALEELPNVPPPEETGLTHLETARGKAVYWSEAFGGLAISSDGGLVIPALGPAWDSVRTRRATGDDAPDAERIGRLLALMGPYEGEDRAALWAEAVVLADDGEVLAEWEVEGPKGYLLRAPVERRIPARARRVTNGSAGALRSSYLVASAQACRARSALE